MRKLSEMKIMANDDMTIEAVAIFKDETFGEITVGYTNEGDGVLCVYDGRINVEDPGIGPLEEYDSKHDALESEYGDEFERIFAVVDLIVTKL